MHTFPFSRVHLTTIWRQRLNSLSIRRYSVWLCTMYVCMYVCVYISIFQGSPEWPWEHPSLRADGRHLRADGPTAELRHLAFPVVRYFSCPPHGGVPVATATTLQGAMLCCRCIHDTFYGYTNLHEIVSETVFQVNWMLAISRKHKITSMMYS